jgi:non-ribosomal peptide synthetase component F
VTLRVDLRGAPTWRELFDRVRRSGSVAYRSADAPFDAVVGALHPDRDLSRPPITPVYVAAADDGRRPPLRGRQLPLDPVAVKYELELTATELDDDLRLTAAYQVDLFDETTIARLLAGFTAAATALVADVDAPCCEET